MTSTSTCITWFAVFVIGSVIIVSVNLLTIIVFIKNRNLRTRAMYLVINLTVADMMVGLLSGSLSPLIYLRFSCDFLNVSLYSLEMLFFLVPFLPLVSVTNIAVISLERMPASGQYTTVFVCLLSVFRTLVFLLNFCVEHIPSTMEQ